MTNARDLYGTRWSEREYIIVLNFYFEHKEEAQHADTPFVQELSRVLGRTPHSILYRLQNFASIDPEEMDPRRKGKAHITDFGRRIFFQWHRKLDSLKDTADVLMREEKAKLIPDLFNPSPERIPVTFKNFELLDEIGKGGSGNVFSCLDTHSNETYALKVIDGSKLLDDECIHRFGREIRALRSIQHPHVIHIYEDNLKTEKNYPGFVMDLAEYNLTSYICHISDKRGKPSYRPMLESRESKEIIASIMDAVQALHQADPPIIHRDINPNNILRLFNGAWVLADFSLAKFLPPAPMSTSFATATHIGAGTANYTAPEQYKSLKSADIRSDIYSLGWLIWELFSSEGPFPRREPSGLPRKLEMVYLKATSYEQEQRYSTVAEMISAFVECWL